MREAVASSSVVLVISPDGDVMRIVPRGARTTIGRASDNDISINDPLVSRRHAVIHHGATPQLEDLGSENGTLVYLPVSDTTPSPDTARQASCHLRKQVMRVDDGTIITIGSTRLVLRAAVSVAPEDAAAVSFTRSARMREVWELARRAAVTQITVMILGETGVGKEVLAEQIHRASSRADQTFLRLNCAAFAETLLESELFGHEKGAFTSAVATKPGLFEAAHGGTVLLDEIGELSLSLQGKLLRLLEDGSVLRVGALRPRTVDVRIIAATNRDLHQEVAAGRFREDLFFRLYGMQLVIPPLRERVEEVRPLAESFVASFAGRDRRPRPMVSDAAMSLLERYPWPGNIRELRHVIERAMVVDVNGCIDIDDLPTSIRSGTPVIARGTPLPMPAVRAGSELPPPAERRVAGTRLSLDRQQVLDALDRCAGNQTRAATELQISRRALVNLIERYDIPRPRK